MPRSRQSQEKHEYKANGVVGFRSTHSDVKALKRNSEEPEIHGNKVWRSSWTLIDYIDKYIKKDLAAPINAMDIGCGWGLLAIYMAKKLQADVIAVDADANVFPFLELQANRNNVELQTLTKRYEELNSKLLKDINIIAGSDICFWDELVKPLYNLINRAIKTDTNYVLISDPGRTTFQELCQLAIDKLADKVDRIEVVEHSITKPFNSSASILVVKIK